MSSSRPSIVTSWHGVERTTFQFRPILLKDLNDRSVESRSIFFIRSLRTPRRSPSSLKFFSQSALDASIANISSAKRDNVGN